MDSKVDKLENIFIFIQLRSQSEASELSDSKLVFWVCTEGCSIASRDEGNEVGGRKFCKLFCKFEEGGEINWKYKGCCIGKVVESSEAVNWGCRDWKFWKIVEVGESLGWGCRFWRQGWGCEGCWFKVVIGELLLWNTPGSLGFGQKNMSLVSLTSL